MIDRAIIRTAAGLIVVATAMLSGGCGGTKTVSAPRDPEFVVMMRQARRTFDEGLVERAAMLYELALKRARATDNPTSIRDAACNLAMCCMRLGRLDEAEILLDESIIEAARLAERPSDLLLTQAKLAFTRGEPDRAEALADEMLSRAPADIDANDRAQAHLLKGRVAAGRGNAAQARQALDAATGRRVSHEDTGIEIETRALLAEIYMLEGALGLAARQFDAQADLLRLASRYREMTDALDRAGESYAGAEMHAEAFDRSYRAARSRLAQGDAEHALMSAERALAAAQATGDASAQSRARAVLARILKAGVGRP